LCKKTFDSLIYDVKSNVEFKRYWLKEKNDFTSNVPFTTSHSLRRAIYLRGLKAIPVKVKSSKLFSKAEFLKDPKYWEIKLSGWIRRELQALLEEDDVELLQLLVLSLLKEHEINSQETVNQLKEWLFENAEVFIFELSQFANSPFNMDAYDKAVRYDYSNATSSIRTQSKEGENDLFSIVNGTFENEEKKL